MDDFASLRQRMVDNQIRTMDVTEPGLIRGFFHLPRERFVPPSLRPFAYTDKELLVSGGAHPRYLLAPALLGRLVQELRLRESDIVLDVGCATGYSSAILAGLASSVVALEEDEGLARAAERTLSELGIDNVAIVQGRLAEGYPSEGPYDAILIAGGVEFVPPAIKAQLRDGGRLSVVEYDGRIGGSIGRAMLYERTGDDVTGRAVMDAVPPLLPGFTRTPGFVF